MNLVDYAPKALAFASYQATVDQDLIHAALGIVSDTGELIECLANHQVAGKELDRTNLIEECGDVLWFCNLASGSLGASLSNLHLRSVETLAEHGTANIPEVQLWLVVSAARIADHIKASTIYKKPLETSEVERELGAIVRNIEIIAAAWDISLGEIMEANIAKLQARYGAKFDAARALLRNAMAEREAINGAVA